MSFPSGYSGSSPTQLTEVLDGEAKDRLVGFREELLLDQESLGIEMDRGGHVKPFMDEVLRNDAVAYADFVRRLYHGGLIVFW